MNYKCPKCDILDEYDHPGYCPQCGNALMVLNKAVAPKKTNPLFILAVVLTFMLLCVFCYFSVYGGGGGSKSTPIPMSESDQSYYACKQFIGDNLKDPSSVQFPDYLADAKVQDLSQSHFLVSMRVRAKNSFGALTLSVFTCKVHHDSSDHWTLESLTEN